MVTRQRFGTLAERFGLRAVHPSRARPFNFLVSSNEPGMAVRAVAGEVSVNDAFLATFTESETIFALGHEAGHRVWGHSGQPRSTQREIQADMWGVEALRAHRLPLYIGVGLLKTYIHRWPGCDITHELSDRIHAMEMAGVYS